MYIVRVTSRLVLALVLLVGTAGSVKGQATLTCANWIMDAANPNAGTCNAFPRGFDNFVTMGLAAFAYPITPTGALCSATQARKSPLSASYSTQSPMGTVRAGQTITLKWAMPPVFNFGTDPAKVRLYGSFAPTAANPTQDPPVTNAQFEASSLLYDTTFTLTNCYADPTLNNAGACVANVQLPATVQSGTYFFQFSWNDQFASCFDLNIQSDAAQANNADGVSTLSTAFDRSAIIGMIAGSLVLVAVIIIAGRVYLYRRNNANAPKSVSP